MPHAKPGKGRREHAPSRTGIPPPAPALAILHDILDGQLSIIRANARRAARTRQPDAIHDLRVAIRRFRTALRIFKRFFGGTDAALLSRQLRALNRRLGPVRDAQVWSEFLAGTARGADTPDWKRCLALAARSRRARENAIPAILATPSFRNLLRRTAAFVRTRLPALQRQGQDAGGPAFLSGTLHRMYDRLPSARIRRTLRDAESAHRFRRRCRRCRYLAEFASPHLGPVAGKLARRLRDVADALGARHDADVYLDRLRLLPDPPRSLLRLIRRRRRKAEQEFEAAWKRLLAPRLRKAVQEERWTQSREAS